ncbi:hypothetical protein MA16_Dca015885 [Dendrobium catenatum]|uniref:Uncharacterized protein n=1 Tax=Dendrobium catenatum TaxID=906689 RepID=A0A2I0VMI7_9ASPA|nr:hypothetical protein MA16_Dca015885 [Dendrobium catenatum]
MCRMWSERDHMSARRGRGLVAFGRGLEAQGVGTEAQGAGGCTGRGIRARGALGLAALDAVRQDICREVELECRWTFFGGGDRHDHSLAVLSRTVVIFCFVKSRLRG